MVQFAPIQSGTSGWDPVGSLKAGAQIGGILGERAQKRDVKDILSRLSDPKERQEALMAAGATDEAAQVQAMESARAGEERAVAGEERDITAFEREQEDRKDERSLKAKERMRQVVSEGTNLLKGLSSAMEGIEGTAQGENVWDIYIEGAMQKLQQDPDTAEWIGTMLGGNGAALDNYSEEGLNIINNMAAFGERSISFLEQEEAPKGQTDLGKTKADYDAGLMTEEQYEQQAKAIMEEENSKREIIDQDGIKYYTDTGEKVLEDVVPPKGKKSSEEARSENLAKESFENFSIVKEELFNKDGSINRSVIPATRSAPFGKSRTFTQAMERGIQNTVYLKTGQAAPASEMKRLLDQYMPSVIDNEEQIRNKLNSFEGYVSSYYQPILDNKDETGQGEGATEGQTATNPKTGEKLTLKNGKWVPL